MWDCVHLYVASSWRFCIFQSICIALLERQCLKSVYILYTVLGRFKQVLYMPKHHYRTEENVSLMVLKVYTDLLWMLSSLLFWDQIEVYVYFFIFLVLLNKLVGLQNVMHEYCAVVFSLGGSAYIYNYMSKY